MTISQIRKDKRVFSFTKNDEDRYDLELNNGYEFDFGGSVEMCDDMADAENLLNQVIENK